MPISLCNFDVFEWAMATGATRSPCSVTAVDNLERRVL